MKLLFSSVFTGCTVVHLHEAGGKEYHEILCSQEHNHHHYQRVSLLQFQGLVLTGLREESNGLYYVWTLVLWDVVEVDVESKERIEEGCCERGHFLSDAFAGHAHCFFLSELLFTVYFCMVISHNIFFFNLKIVLYCFATLLLLPSIICNLQIDKDS